MYRIPNIWHVSFWWFHLLINPQVKVTCRHRFLLTFNTHPRTHPSSPPPPPPAHIRRLIHSASFLCSISVALNDTATALKMKQNTILRRRKDVPRIVEWWHSRLPIPTYICTPLQSLLAHTLLRTIQTGSGAHAAYQQVPELKRSGRQGDDTS